VISLYFHIPFCTKKCPYCHFYVVPNQQRFHTLLMEGLELEWEQTLPILKSFGEPTLPLVSSIYFGGGTPSLLGPQHVGRLLERCRDLPWAPDCEVTLEANPEESSTELFSLYRAKGINRVSLGVQSLDDRSLVTLERGHTAKKAKQALRDVAEAGIQNLSIDLMYDLPDQTESSWHYTLDQLSDLPIQHLSLYNLTIEPHTSFSKRTLSLPSQEESLRFLHAALKRLETLGLKRYEISAFAKPGFASKHNLGYWQFRPFWGFGPSAFSYWQGERFQNVPHLQRYTRALRDKKSSVHFREKLPYPASFKEQLAVQLRLIEGVSLPKQIPEETAQALEKLEAQGWIQRAGEKVALTEQGLLFYDAVAASII
jgi:oxygen-independent coproporphyrinogen-3 oxidase